MCNKLPNPANTSTNTPRPPLIVRDCSSEIAHFSLHQHSCHLRAHIFYVHLMLSTLHGVSTVVGSTELQILLRKLPKVDSDETKVLQQLKALLHAEYKSMEQVDLLEEGASSDERLVRAIFLVVAQRNILASHILPFLRAHAKSTKIGSLVFSIIHLLAVGPPTFPPEAPPLLTSVATAELAASDRICRTLASPTSLAAIVSCVEFQLSHRLSGPLNKVGTQLIELYLNILLGILKPPTLNVSSTISAVRRVVSADAVACMHATKALSTAAFVAIAASDVQEMHALGSAAGPRASPWFARECAETKERSFRWGLVFMAVAGAVLSQCTPESAAAALVGDDADSHGARDRAGEEKKGQRGRGRGAGCGGEGAHIGGPGSDVGSDVDSLGGGMQAGGGDDDGGGASAAAVTGARGRGVGRVGGPGGNAVSAGVAAKRQSQAAVARMRAAMRGAMSFCAARASAGAGTTAYETGLVMRKRAVVDEAAGVATGTTASVLLAASMADKKLNAGVDEVAKTAARWSKQSRTIAPRAAAAGGGSIRCAEAVGRFASLLLSDVVPSLAEHWFPEVIAAAGAAQPGSTVLPIDVCAMFEVCGTLAGIARRHAAQVGTDAAPHPLALYPGLRHLLSEKLVRGAFVNVNRLTFAATSAVADKARPDWSGVPAPLTFLRETVGMLVGLVRSQTIAIAYAAVRASALRLAAAVVRRADHVQVLVDTMVGAASHVAPADIRRLSLQALHAVAMCVDALCSEDGTVFVRKLRRGKGDRAALAKARALRAQKENDGEGDGGDEDAELLQQFEEEEAGGGEEDIADAVDVAAIEAEEAPVDAVELLSVFAQPKMTAALLSVLRDHATLDSATTVALAGALQRICGPLNASAALWHIPWLEAGRAVLATTTEQTAGGKVFVTREGERVAASYDSYTLLRSACCVAVRSFLEALREDPTLLIAIHFAPTPSDVLRVQQGDFIAGDESVGEANGEGAAGEEEWREGGLAVEAADDGIDLDDVSEFERGRDGNGLYKDTYGEGERGEGDYEQGRPVHQKDVLRGMSVKPGADNVDDYTIAAIVCERAATAVASAQADDVYGSFLDAVITLPTVVLFAAERSEVTNQLTEAAHVRLRSEGEEEVSVVEDAAKFVLRGCEAIAIEELGKVGVAVRRRVMGSSEDNDVSMEGEGGGDGDAAAVGERLAAVAAEGEVELTSRHWYTLAAAAAAAGGEVDRFVGGVAQRVAVHLLSQAAGGGAAASSLPGVVAAVVRRVMVVAEDGSGAAAGGGGSVEAAAKRVASGAGVLLKPTEWLVEGDLPPSATVPSLRDAVQSTRIEQDDDAAGVLVAARVPMDALSATAGLLTELSSTAAVEVTSAYAAALSCWETVRVLDAAGVDVVADGEGSSLPILAGGGAAAASASLDSDEDGADGAAVDTVGSMGGPTLTAASQSTVLPATQMTVAERVAAVAVHARGGAACPLGKVLRDLWIRRLRIAMDGVRACDAAAAAAAAATSAAPAEDVSVTREGNGVGAYASTLGPSGRNVRSSTRRRRGVVDDDSSSDSSVSERSSGDVSMSGRRNRRGGVRSRVHARSALHSIGAEENRVGAGAGSRRARSSGVSEDSMRFVDTTKRGRGVVEGGDDDALDGLLDDAVSDGPSAASDAGRGTTLLRRGRGVGSRRRSPSQSTVSEAQAPSLALSPRSGNDDVDAGPSSEAEGGPSRQTPRRGGTLRAERRASRRGAQSQVSPARTPSPGRSALSSAAPSGRSSSTLPDGTGGEGERGEAAGAKTGERGGGLLTRRQLRSALRNAFDKAPAAASEAVAGDVERGEGAPLAVTAGEDFEKDSHERRVGERSAAPGGGLQTSVTGQMPPKMSSVDVDVLAMLDDDDE